MRYFIKLTGMTGKPVYLDPEKIIGMEEGYSGYSELPKGAVCNTTLHLGDARVHVRETIANIEAHPASHIKVV